ncbi:hypothetical protein M011DRAFT_465087 [Sporormia fimetaria CBS 119925]|uniref:Macro domain-containing protein n=1 Tax=Sporormia fimetaria CBS 119925 TaxID=1340428 RepID=A0A6A6VKJ0_9PLEO|nr:hypothetical protein M011DRAFT_465087 [Sporormia fimetaria CBS 119925]
MTTIRLRTAAVVRGFHTLTTALTTDTAGLGYIIDKTSLDDEIGRFRVWAGNLGALQKGHSSADYRLRDSPLLSGNLLKLLQELDENINESVAVLLGTRLPYEQQLAESGATSDEEGDFYSDDSDDESNGAPRTELDQRFREIIDIIDNLYKLSVRIRQPTLRTRSLKAASYQPKDPETGVDILGQYAAYDRQHTEELVSHLRAENTENVDVSNDALVERLSKAITLRRRQFKYWRRHRDKLGQESLIEEGPHALPPAVSNQDDLKRRDTMEAQPGVPLVAAIREAPSQKTGKTMLSGTEATAHHQSLDDIVDSKSVTSYATTVRDTSGKGIELPPPPKGSDSERDFECPYCFIICPARYGKGRGWRTHLLQDLQPYLCTYSDCDHSEQLFRSRREWIDHESFHRKAWRCPEHPHAVYSSRTGLEKHLQSDHKENFPRIQLESIIKVGETSSVDMRKKCPICLADADDTLGPLHNHIAHHLERLASFSLPIVAQDDVSAAGSSIASGAPSTLSGFSSTGTVSNESETSVQLKTSHPSTVAGPEASDEGAARSERGILSVEAIERVIDSSSDRLDMLMSKSANPLEPSELVKKPLSENEGVSMGNKTNLSLLGLSDVPTLQELYTSGSLVVESHDDLFPPDESLNSVVAFCHYDITRLQADCIVNSAVPADRVNRTPGLNRHINEAAGPELMQESRQYGSAKPGFTWLSKGYNLPSSYVIHVTCPSYVRAAMSQGLSLLAECYRNVLLTAMNHQIKNIVFPCLATGGKGFPSRAAAKTALQEVRAFLDLRGSHTFERIVFCVYNAADDKNFRKALPSFFPPTAEDLRDITTQEKRSDRPSIMVELQDVGDIVSSASSALINIPTNVPEFDWIAYNELSLIQSSLGALRCSIEPKTDDPGWGDEVVSDVRLICSVLNVAMGGLLEMISQARRSHDRTEDTSRFSSSEASRVWTDLNLHLKTTHDLDFRSLLKICREFLQTLDVTGKSQAHSLIFMRDLLESYLAVETGGQHGDVKGHLELVMQTREYQRETLEQSRLNAVKLNAIPSLLRLYQMGKLEAIPTTATSNSYELSTVCMIKEDITRLDVDAIVNSTDIGFNGLGSLDRTVFERGGPRMREDCMNFGICKTGDVRVTQGYLLPARHVIHTIPPTSRAGSREEFRKLYRDILETARNVQAQSLAIPAIGTGAAMFPLKDLVRIALEEVKKFLEDTYYSEAMMKIIFCIYSPVEEAAYKALLPLYFPPMEASFITASVHGDNIQSSEEDRPSGDAKPRRTLFGSLGDAVRNVRIGKQLANESSRSLNEEEKGALLNFDNHARNCTTCNDLLRLYSEGLTLCPEGYAAAQALIQYLYMDEAKTVYSFDRENGHQVRVEFPFDHKHAMDLLSIVEDSFRDVERDTPFVSANQPYPEIQDEATQSSHNIGPFKRNEDEMIATIHVWSQETQQLEMLSPNECSVQVVPGKVDVYHMGPKSHKLELLLSLELGPAAAFIKAGNLDVALRAPAFPNSPNKPTDDIVFRSRRRTDCEKLFRQLVDAKRGTVQKTTDLSPGMDGASERVTWDERVFIYNRKGDAEWQPLQPEECTVVRDGPKLEFHAAGGGEPSILDLDNYHWFISLPNDEVDILLRRRPREDEDHAPTEPNSSLFTSRMLYTLRCRNPQEAAQLYKAINEVYLHYKSMQARNDHRRLVLPDVPTEAPVFSMFSTPKREATSSSRPVQPSTKEKISDEFLESAGRMLVLLQSTEPQGAKVSFSTIERQMEQGIMRVKAMAHHLADLGLVEVSDDFVQVKRKDSSAGPDVLSRSSTAIAETDEDELTARVRHLFGTAPDGAIWHETYVAGVLKCEVSAVRQALNKLKGKRLVDNPMSDDEADERWNSQLWVTTQPSIGLDAIDRAILRELRSSSPSRRSIIELSEALHLTFKEVTERLSVLEKHGGVNSVNGSWTLTHLSNEGEASGQPSTGELNTMSRKEEHGEDDQKPMARQMEEPMLAVADPALDDTFVADSEHYQDPADLSKSRASRTADPNQVAQGRPDLSYINMDDFVTYIDQALSRPQSPLPSDDEAYTRPAKKKASSSASSLSSDDEDYARQRRKGRAEEAGSSTVHHPRPTSPDHTQSKPIPPGTRWTKIDRRLVSPQALDEAKEQYEERSSHVVVFRFLSKEEIQDLAVQTGKIGMEKLL